jgi:hypothetical protein
MHRAGDYPRRASDGKRGWKGIYIEKTFLRVTAEGEGARLLTVQEGTGIAIATIYGKYAD